MRGSLGLSAYRTLTGRKTPSDYQPSAPRPDGDLIWVHAGEPRNTRPLNDLAHRLVGQMAGTHVVLTAAEGTFGDRGVAHVQRTDLPEEHPDTARQFVEHWKPDAVIWAWGGLRPNVILAAADHGAHMILADASRDGFENRRDRWVPDLPKQVLARFDHLLARSVPAQGRLVQLGCSPTDIRLVDRLEPFGRMLPVAESDLDEVSSVFRGRPLWGAVDVTAKEVAAVLRAHRRALKVSHRLLLILCIADAAARDELEALSQQADMRVSDWDAGELPDDNSEIILTDTREDLGLWLRCAPVVFVGGTMDAGHTQLDPYIPAAHGAAILYGPHVGEFVNAYSRLMNAGAAHIVSDGPSLGTAVRQLLAPDRAAQMAMAGWEVTTRGAASHDAIIDLVQDHFDTRDTGAN